jgi:hypothetical protein
MMNARVAPKASAKARARAIPEPCEAPAVTTCRQMIITIVASDASITVSPQSALWAQGQRLPRGTRDKPIASLPLTTDHRVPTIVAHGPVAPSASLCACMPAIVGGARAREGR